MRYLVFFSAVCIHAQTTLTLVPDVITHCSNNVVSVGRATVVWNYSGPGPVQVRVVAPDGPSMTGLVPSNGTAPTGDWVHDGLVFVLADAGSQELARATAHVRCNPAGEVLPAGLAAASYFPLQVGDEWVYADNDRTITGAYITRRVARAELIGTTLWFVIEDTVSGDNKPAETRFRNDDQGRIYQLTFQGEQLWLDPTNPANPSAILKIDGRGFLVQTPVGQFRDTLSYNGFFGGLVMENGVFTRGIGLLMRSQNMLSGSSGGFLQSLNLVYARIDGHIFYTAPSKSIELGVDANDFDVSNKNTANCALPCYFVACGLGGPVDPPGAYTIRPVRPEYDGRSGRAGRIEQQPLSYDAGHALRSGRHPLPPTPAILRAQPAFPTRRISIACADARRQPGHRTDSVALITSSP
jgi:hypothetical protein